MPKALYLLWVRVMKYLLIICLLLSPIVEAVDFDIPLLQPNDVADLIDKYLIEEMDIDPKGYSIISVSYEYVGNISQGGYWNIMYVAIPSSEGGGALSAHFNVQMGNGEKPWYKFIGGL